MARTFSSTLYADCGTGLFGVSVMTISFWLYPISMATVYKAAIARRQSGGAALVFFIGESGTANKLSYYFNASAVSIDPGSTALSTNTWYHVAATYDHGAGALKGFINGASDGTAVTNTTLSTDASQSVFLGHDATLGNFNGRMADAAIWQVALSASEILALAKGARPYRIRPASLIAYWPLDGLASPEPDLSGLKNNGTLVGTPVSDFGPPLQLFTPRRPQLLDVFNPVIPPIFHSGFASAEW